MRLTLLTKLEQHCFLFCVATTVFNPTLMKHDLIWACFLMVLNLLDALMIAFLQTLTPYRSICYDISVL